MDLRSTFRIGSIGLLVACLAACFLACGEEDTSIGGVDANKDGVRDDVADAIRDRWQGDERNAALQLAGVLQKALLHAEDKELSIEHADEGGRAIECVIGVMEEKYEHDAFEMAENMVEDVEDMVVNTRTRRHVYETIFNTQLAGAYGMHNPRDMRKSCDF